MRDDPIDRLASSENVKRKMLKILHPVITYAIVKVCILLQSSFCEVVNSM